MDEKRLLIAAFLSLGLILVWPLLFPAPPGETPVVDEATLESVENVSEEAAPMADPAGEPVKVEAEETSLVPDVAPEPLPAVSGTVEERLVVENEEFRAEFSSLGARLVSFRLKEHLGSDGEELELVRRRGVGPWPFSLVAKGAPVAPVGLDEVLWAAERRQVEGETELSFAYRGPAGEGRKVFRFGARNPFGVEVRGRGPKGEELGIFLGPGLGNPSDKERSGRFQIRNAVYRLSGEVEKVNARKVGEREVLPGGGLGWFGVGDTYFIAVVVPETPVEAAWIVPVLEEETGEGQPPGFREKAAAEEVDKKTHREVALVAWCGEDGLAGAAFFGAKTYKRLAEQPWGLDNLINWGWFGFVSRPLLVGLEWIHTNVVQNYGWAIVLMTFLLKLVLLPLTHKSHVSMKKMQALNPRVQGIRSKYKSKMRDKQGRYNVESQRKMNEEMQALYRTEGVNPASGCVPMLIQLPVFFGFFRLLSSAVQLRGAPWVGWIHDLAAPDPLYILPVLMGATQLLQQRLTPAAGDPMQRRMMQMLPIMFVIFSFGFPSGLVLYWMVSNGLSIVQIAVYNRLKERAAARA